MTRLERDLGLDKLDHRGIGRLVHRDARNAESPDLGDDGLRAATETVGPVNIFLGIVVAFLAAAVSVASILFIRRRAPEGGYFADGDRAAGFFGVLSTGFSILLGFIVFLSFASYDESRSGAEAEATTVAQQFETAQFFDDDTAGQLGGQLICYGKYVVNEEWPEMRSGGLGDQINPWGLELYKTILATEPTTNAQGSAYDKWLDQTLRARAGTTRPGARCRGPTSSERPTMCSAPCCAPSRCSSPG